MSNIKYNLNLLLLATEFLDSSKYIYNKGRWTKEEHFKFLIGLKYFGKNNILIQKLVKTRSLIQIRSHSQKFFKKIYKKN